MASIRNLNNSETAAQESGKVNCGKANTSNAGQGTALQAHHIHQGTSGKDEPSPAYKRKTCEHGTRHDTPPSKQIHSTHTEDAEQAPVLSPSWRPSNKYFQTPVGVASDEPQDKSALKIYIWGVFNPTQVALRMK